MSEFGGHASDVASAVAIILLLVLLAEHEVLRVTVTSWMRDRRSVLVIAIVPLLVVFVFVAVLRLTHIATTHP